MFLAGDLRNLIGQPVTVIFPDVHHLGPLEDLGNGGYRVIDSDLGTRTFHENRITAIYGHLIYLIPLPGIAQPEFVIWGEDEPEVDKGYDPNYDGNPVDPPEDD